MFFEIITKVPPTTLIEASTKAENPRMEDNMGSSVAPLAMSAPTMVMPLTAFDPDMRGVCNVGGTFVMISKNITTLLLSLIDDDGKLQLNMEDEVVNSSLVTRDGEVVHPEVRKILGLSSAETVGSDA